MQKIVVENGQAFVVFEDGSKHMLPIVHSQTTEIRTLVALENGMIVAAETAISVARVERNYWKALAEQRGEALANLRAGGGK